MFWFAMPYATLTEKLLNVVDRMPNERALSLRVNGRWEPTSSAEFLRRIAGLSNALEQLGVKPGDRVGLFAPNRPEWHVADFAILGLGAADVPIYFNESLDRIVYILNHSGAEVVIVAGEMQARRLLECRSRLKSVKHVICAAAPPDLGEDILRYETLVAATGDAAIAEYRLRAARVTSRPNRNNHLYLRHNGRAEGRDAHAQQSQLERANFGRALSHDTRRYGGKFSAALARV